MEYKYIVYALFVIQLLNVIYILSNRLSLTTVVIGMVRLAILLVCSIIVSL